MSSVAIVFRPIGGDPVTADMGTLVRGLKAKAHGSNFMAKCPSHEDEKASLSIKESGGRLLVHCHAGCSPENVIGALRDAGLWPSHSNGSNGNHKPSIVAEYPYTDEAGHLLYESIRYQPKDFRVRRPDGSGGSIWNLQGTRLVPYRLPKILSASEVFIVEGEKDVATIEAWGHVATSNHGGAGKWRAEFSEFFAGRHVVIIPDNDTPGLKHAYQVARNLLPVAASVKVVRLPGLPEKGDVTDWRAAGGTADQFVELCTAARALDEDELTELGLNWGVVSGDTNQRPVPIAAGSEDSASETPNLLCGLHRDYGNAQRLIVMYGSDLRYCHAFKKWLVWDGRRWKTDEVERARELAQLTMIEFLRQALKATNDGGVAEKFAKESLDSKRITNALREAQGPLAIMPAQLDTHPYLLNFLNGTVDVRTGKLQAHQREHFITKLVHYNYSPSAGCPVFQSFLARSMGNAADAPEEALDRAERLLSYLQKAFGYSLTGTTTEKAVFLLHGPGDNGKSTLLSVFLEILEEYAVLLQIDTLMVRQESNNTQADLADLRGARFVMTSETEEGQRLAEGKLKRITQGMGRIKATRKYENPIEFDESHKLWIDANHLPVVRGTDNAIWNRLHPIPFEVTIPKSEQDRNLRQKLLSEAEGILAWAGRGAMAWHREGLGKPAEVENAGAAWRAEANQMGRFIEAVCERRQEYRGRAREMYLSYKRWAEAVGEHIQSEANFCKKLSDQGFPRDRDEKGNYYKGIQPQWRNQ